MSRIFDALRKYEQERAGKKPGARESGESHWPDLLDSFENPEFDLSSVPRITCTIGGEERIVVAGSGHHAACERFRVLRHRIQQMSQTRPMKKLLITSASPQEGKTSITVNLAATFSLSSARSLLIEGDMRNPGVARLLKVDPYPGLADVVEGRCSLGAALRFVDPLGIYYLPAGKITHNPVELLQSEKMQELVAEAAEVFDWVLLDSPPLQLFADAHCLATVSDAILLVVRMGQTTPEALEEGARILAGAPLAGIVLNGVKDHMGDNYYSYYTKDPRQDKKGQDRVPAVQLKTGRAERRD